MTVCNMSIEMGARGGIIAPDQTTFDYIQGREFAPQGEKWDKKLAYWKTLVTDKETTYDKVISFNAANIAPMITFGTNPAMGIKISENVPSANGDKSFAKALDYMQVKADAPIKGKQVDYVFIGSCTNARIEDLRAVANIVKGHKKADNITAWIVPGSKRVEVQAIEEGLDKILQEAGFELRQPGCSACLAMNEDKVPEGKYCVSTSNRNFEGRQGHGSRTLLASPETAAATALKGFVTDATEYLKN